MKHDARVMAMLAAASLALPGLAARGDVEPWEFGYAPPDLDPRRSDFRKGRRSNYGRPVVTGSQSRAAIANRDNPAGTKLAKKMARGQLTKNGIR